MDRAVALRFGALFHDIAKPATRAERDGFVGFKGHDVEGAEVIGSIMARLRASRKLTRYLQARFGIRTRNVIGHAESLSSPYHYERVKAMRNATHGDFAHATMRRYRAKL